MLNWGINKEPDLSVTFSEVVQTNLEPAQCDSDTREVREKPNLKWKGSIVPMQERWFVVTLFNARAHHSEAMARSINASTRSSEWKISRCMPREWQYQGNLRGHNWLGLQSYFGRESSVDRLHVAMRETFQVLGGSMGWQHAGATLFLLSFCFRSVSGRRKGSVTDVFSICTHYLCRSGKEGLHFGAKPKVVPQLTFPMTGVMFQAVSFNNKGSVQNWRIGATPYINKTQLWSLKTCCPWGLVGMKLLIE